MTAGSGKHRFRARVDLTELEGDPKKRLQKTPKSVSEAHIRDVVGLDDDELVQAATERWADDPAVGSQRPSRPPFVYLLKITFGRSPGTRRLRTFAFEEITRRSLSSDWLDEYPVGVELHYRNVYRACVLNSPRQPLRRYDAPQPLPSLTRIALECSLLEAYGFDNRVILPHLYYLKFPGYIPGDLCRSVRKRDSYRSQRETEWLYRVGKPQLG